MTSAYARDRVVTFVRSTVQDEYSMTSEHACEKVETIDRSTIRFRGPFVEFQKTVKKHKITLI